MVVPVYFCYFTSATMVTSFILYKGLKAPATTLVTMVLGFLVTCFGITLLQMSKVDPKQLQHLDRRSTLLLAAARHGTEDQEKGRVTAMEDPGMDALRSGFGAVGSVIRARSISRRMSTASSANGGYPFGQGGGHLNTHGLGALQRYQREYPSEKSTEVLAEEVEYPEVHVYPDDYPQTTPSVTPVATPSPPSEVASDESIVGRSRSRTM